MAIGDFVEWDPKDTWVKLGNSVLLEFDSGPAAGHLALLEKVEGSGSEGGPTLRRKLRADAIAEFGLLDPEAKLPPLKEKPGAPGPADPPKEVDDARTLAVTRNRRGRRNKAFADAVDELVEDQYDDWPLKDHVRSLLNICERMSTDGLAPVAWIEAYLARKKYQDSDRSQHELRCLARILETALLYDQLNIASLASFEHMAHRMQLVIGAHAVGPANPTYVGSEFYGGAEDGEELIAPELRWKVNDGTKSQAKILEVQQKQRELKRPPPKGNPKGGDKL